MYNPRGLSWKALFGVIIAAFWELLTRWFRHPIQTATASSAAQGVDADYIELCGIEAQVYSAGDEVFWDGFLKNFGDYVWWFEDPAVRKLQDVFIHPLEGEKKETAYFKSRAVRFEFYPVFNPEYVRRHPMNVQSAMEIDLASGQEFASMMFEDDETHSLKRMAQIAIARADEWLHHAVFVGVFKVWWDEYRGEDGGVDNVRVWAEFVREFDMEAQLTRYISPPVLIKEGKLTST